jgi:hypothetical protein
MTSCGFPSTVVNKSASRYHGTGFKSLWLQKEGYEKKIMNDCLYSNRSSLEIMFLSRSVNLDFLLIILNHCE